MRRWLVVLVTVCSIYFLGVGRPSATPNPRAVDRFLQQQLDRFKAHSGGVRASAANTGPVLENFELLAHLDLPGESPHADVFFYDHGGNVGRFAYIGTWGAGCAGTGVKIIDVNDPRHPVLVAFAGTEAGESKEDMVIRRIGGRDIMGVGAQICGEGGRGGLALFDVTDPRHPVKLSFLEMPAGGVHELDMVVRPDGRALALLADPFVEFDNVYFGANNGGDFRIVDITHPAHPVEVASWGIIADSHLPILAGNDEVSSPFQGVGYFAAYFDHSARAADYGMTAYVSYWDGGVLKFDISHPERPVLLGRTLQAFDQEGDTHSLTTYEAKGGRYILTNDEDGVSLSPTVFTSTATHGTKYAGIEWFLAPTLLSQVGTMRGQVFDAGDGCQAADYRGAEGKFVLADTVDPFYVGIIPGWEVPCDIGDQVLFAHDAGAKAFVPNLISPDDAYIFFTEVDVSGATGMPVVMIADIDEEAQAIRAALKHHSVRVRLNPGAPSRGFLRVFQERKGKDRDQDGVVEFPQVGRFWDLPNVRGPIDPPPGVWEIHNTEVLGNRGYSSWYSHGIVALDLTHPKHPDKVGQFVPPPSDNFEEFFGPPFPMVWGVAIDPLTRIIYASDMRSGLWIVRPIGPAAPSG